MKFLIPDMSCGHCKAVVERTIIDLDSNADVVVNVAAKTAEVKTTSAPEAILTALKAEGYPAKLVG
ncbi:heavy-metal-associated domain-containing protein [Defluviimonas sp. WL0024]|uniref:Heavy-metal-associated domain-containing protein n=2 Tax=Albidovulum TaxID=205889 RepID=A0ABT3J9H8_9RHOB|nr:MULTISPECIES: heavy-metal-associated domain-containing protein [Defluviimonas]MCU9849799.1 heavy-metal-associated domain-containing protein [Defluviimonas sp. WL0024]MCW3784044.1 heavy-metal-associated domain-containing protein [Defluviimonas salinarum]